MGEFLGLDSKKWELLAANRCSQVFLKLEPGWDGGTSALSCVQKGWDVWVGGRVPCVRAFTIGVFRIEQTILNKSTCNSHYSKLSIIKRTTRSLFCGVTLQVKSKPFMKNQSQGSKRSPAGAQVLKQCSQSHTQTLMELPAQWRKGTLLPHSTNLITVTLEMGIWVSGPAFWGVWVHPPVWMHWMHFSLHDSRNIWKKHEHGFLITIKLGEEIHGLGRLMEGK